MCWHWAMCVSVICSLALFVSVHVHSLSGRWPNPYLAVRSWYVYCVLNIWWVSLPRHDIQQLRSIGGDLVPRMPLCLNYKIMCYSVEAWLARSHVIALPHMQTTRIGEEKKKKKKLLFQAILRMTQYAPCTAQKEIKTQINELVLYVQGLASLTGWVQLGDMLVLLSLFHHGHQGLSYATKPFQKHTIAAYYLCYAATQWLPKNIGQTQSKNRRRFIA